MSKPHDEARAVIRGQIQGHAKQIDLLRIDIENHMRAVGNDKNSIGILEDRISDLEQTIRMLDE